MKIIINISKIYHEIELRVLFLPTYIIRLKRVVNINHFKNMRASKVKTII